MVRHRNLIIYLFQFVLELCGKCHLMGMKNNLSSFELMNILMWKHLKIEIYNCSGHSFKIINWRFACQVVLERLLTGIVQLSQRQIVEPIRKIYHAPRKLLMARLSSA